MSKLFFKILLTLIALLIISLAIMWYFKTNDNPINEGTCTIIIKNEKNEIITSDSFLIKGQSLYQLLDENFELKTEKSSFLGFYIVNINDVITDANNYFFALYLNGQFSNKGVSNTYPKDGDIVELVVQKK